MDSESSKESFVASSSLIPDAWGEVAWKQKGFHEDSVTFVVARLVPSSRDLIQHSGTASKGPEKNIRIKTQDRVPDSAFL